MSQYSILLNYQNTNQDRLKFLIKNNKIRVSVDLVS